MKNTRPPRDRRIPIAETPNLRRYSIIPARAVQDDSLHYTTLRILMALSLHSNKNGICWPSRETLARHTSRSVATVTRHITRLCKAGYVRRLSLKNTGYKRSSRWLTRRYQILYDGPASLIPTDEQIYAPAPRVAGEAEPDKKGESENHNHTVSRAIVGGFLAGTLAGSGVVRQPEQSLSEAARLASLGLEPAFVREIAEQEARRAVAAGHQPAINLHELQLGK